MSSSDCLKQHLFPNDLNLESKKVHLCCSHDTNYCVSCLMEPCMPFGIGEITNCMRNTKFVPRQFTSEVTQSLRHPSMLCLEEGGGLTVGEPGKC